MLIEIALIKTRRKCEGCESERAAMAMCAREFAAEMINKANGQTAAWTR